MKIKKVLMCVAILTVCAGGIYLVTLWNSMSVDFDQFEEDEDEEPSVSELRNWSGIIKQELLKYCLQQKKKQENIFVKMIEEHVDVKAELV